MTTQTDVESFLANGGQITHCPNFKPKPYLESKRHQEPDIAARHAARNTPAKKHRGTPLPAEYLSHTEVLHRLGWGVDAAAGRRLTRAVEAGKFPPPDITMMEYGKVFKGWLEETLVAHENRLKNHA